jgi:DNA mismatch repair protein MutS2
MSEVSRQKFQFQDLDWLQFLQYAQTEARTAYGKQKILELQDSSLFVSTMDRAQELQMETSEAHVLIDREALWGCLRDLPEVDDDLDSLSKKGVLEVQALVRLRGWLLAMDSWLNFPREHAGKFFKLALSNLMNPQDCLRTLNRVIGPTGELLETASPKLASITAQIRDRRKQISVRMETLVRDYGLQGVLQEKYSDVREGRYVLPVKVSEQGKVDGRIAELSVSKQTVFIEPKEVEQLHSQLRRLQAEESEEIFTILSTVSAQLFPYVDAIAGSIEIVSDWDAIQARARLAKKYGGRPIVVNSERAFRLMDTVNPMLFWALPENQIVRNSIDLTPPQQMILLSGPNTGGKTVLLKTLGLAALAARTGFFYPGTGKLQVPFFDSFFIDLGDPQSIDQHISSFSGHVIKMKNILESLGPRSLILVDEMNSATDPEEGAALSRAFVETLLSQAGVMLVATTHDPRLKVMGMNDVRILNASILFNENSMRPTYQLVFGAPGRSRALETAERFGMPASVLNLAKSYLSQEHQELETVLSKFQQELEQHEKARRQVVQLQQDAERLKLEWEHRVQVQVQESIEKARSKLKHVLELAQIEVRETLKKIQSTKSFKQMEERRSELNEVFERGKQRIDQSVLEAAPELAPALNAEAPVVEAKPVAEFSVGLWVRVPKWKNVGEIIEWDGKKARVILGTGSNLSSSAGLGKVFVVTVFPVEMEILSERELKTLQNVQGVSSAKQKSAVKIKSEDIARMPEQLDVRGQRLDEALAQVQLYIDRAFRAGNGEVTVVHGLGTGALREGIRSLLARTNFVVDFADAGSAGATRVRFSGES